MTVAEEAYVLYPENPQHLRAAANRPDHVFFKKYGQQVPKNEWNDPGTKQGIYMIGPNSEYLEAKFASSNAKDIAARMNRALATWEKLRKEKGYANKPVPEVQSGPEDADLLNMPLLFEVTLRDLPRTSGNKVARFEDIGSVDEIWPEFRKWAWNQNWIGFDSASGFVTDSTSPVPVSSAAFRKMCREVFVDNVRGQAPRWNDSHIKSANLTKRLVSQKGNNWEIEYKGSAVMDAGAQNYSPTIYGKATWNAETEKFTKFDLVAAGTRTGAWQFNSRDDDRGSAPMGIALHLYPTK